MFTFFFQSPLRSIPPVSPKFLFRLLLLLLPLLFVPSRLLLQPLHTLPTLEVDVRMTVYALADGTIIVYNPVAPTEETLREVEDAFGQPGARKLRSSTRRVQTVLVS